jgi:hypothetical protein
MAHAYTPGLKVTRYTVLTKSRILPLQGEVLVSVGEQVVPDTVVARTMLPGDVTPVNVANVLGVDPADVPGCMEKQENDACVAGERIAESRSFFGMFKHTVAAPHEGTIESVSRVTGQVIIRKPPMPVQIAAYTRGTVTRIIENEGVEIECACAFIQGIFGIGGETHGPVTFACEQPSGMLDENGVSGALRGSVVVGGAQVTAAAIRKLIAAGARGLITGGIDDIDLREFLGYDIGVAITGTEDIGITIVVTEGFGAISMSDRTFGLLREHTGEEASISGATQIRAGVIRPEIIIPLSRAAAGKDPQTESHRGLQEGTPVRIIRQPRFGVHGTVYALPYELQILESGSRARVVEVRLESGETVTIPRANIEILEG